MKELDPTEHWTKIKEIMLTKGEKVLRLRQRQYAKDWIAEETWKEINRCKITKQKINNANDEIKPTLLAEYSEINKRVTKYARRDKRTWADTLAHKAQLAADANNLKELYQIAKRLAGKPIVPQQIGVRDLTGCLLTAPQNRLTRWQEYFNDNFAAPPQQIAMNTTQMTPKTTKIPTGAPTMNEIKTAIKRLKLNKASGPDNLPAEFFRTYPSTTANIMEPLLKKRRGIPDKYQTTGNKGLL
jgi:hypothetical protein